MEETHRGMVEEIDDTELGYVRVRELTHADLLVGASIAVPHRITGLCDISMKIT